LKLSDVTKISDKIKEKIDQVVKDQKEKKFLIEILERELTYSAQEKPIDSKIKQEFKLILEHNFQYKESED